ncbi:DUF4145 domain-containing protein [Streptomyces lonegramiae]|uniref:DUF4145 domain-containing protein n=1 Tax=Streptomyces lonegramiae TaxID=3075524 RepID=A0ABU2XJD7_9ACTN|nr:DUF4145 domain-containing protein [Streptomyces sp. DSM 41529]MDT0545610.1 DUF4145 domain-containing protein [Streptomyces sp. DSM 41529]
MQIAERRELQALIQTLRDGTKRNLTLFTIKLTCDYCSANCLYLWEVINPTEKDSKARYETIELTQVYPEPEPQPRQISSDAPSLVREIFREAALAEAAGAYRLAGVGYRAVVEQIAKEQGATGSNLHNRITSLAAQGVPQNIVDAFHEARIVGNDAVHDGLAYSSEEIADIAELIDEAVFILYVQPAQRARMAAARAARRQAAKSST